MGLVNIIKEIGHTEVFYAPKAGRFCKGLALLWATMASVQIMGFISVDTFLPYIGLCLVSILYCLCDGSVQFKGRYVFLYLVFLFNVLVLPIEPCFNSKLRFVQFLIVTLACSACISSARAIIFRRYVFRYALMYICILSIGSFFAFFLGVNYMQVGTQLGLAEYSSNGGTFGGLVNHSMTLGPISMISALAFYVIYQNNNSKIFATVDIPYGYKVSDDVAKNRIKGLKTLVRTAYEVSYKDGKGELNEWKVNKEDKFNVGSSATGHQQSYTTYYAFFKENNYISGKHYYAIVNAAYDNYSNATKYVLGYQKAGVSDYDGAATLKNQVLGETRTSAFAIEPDNTPLYRRFSSLELEGNEGDKADTLRFIEKYRKEYLQVENNKNFMKEGIDFLGIYTPDKTEDGLSFIVDTAWVNRGSGNIKPQYLISIDRNDFEGVEGVPCTEDDHHFTAEGKPTDKWHCVHAKPAVPGFERGKYLINFHDFANKYGWSTLSNGEQDADYMWKKYDRAGFVEAIRVADTLYILRDEFKNLPNEKINFADLNKAEEDAWTAAKKAGVSEDEFVSHKYILSGDNHKYVTWSMRFVNKEVAANEVEADRAFLFESMKSKHVPGYNNSAMGDIAPTYAAWLRMQNGCLVLSDDRSSNFDEMNTGGDDALIFNVEQGDDIATDNETIDAVEGISVVAGNGTVTVQGAAGKSVVITNILGKVIAETVLTSDNATISVPAGIVAVAVDGEEAVKAIVK